MTIRNITVCSDWETEIVAQKDFCRWLGEDQLIAFAKT